MTQSAFTRLAGSQGSVFAGADICTHTGFGLHPGHHRPRFDADVWDFGGVVGLPVQMPRSEQIFNFTAIANIRWRLVAKELMFALLVPKHEAVAMLPGAYRTPLGLRTCHHRLEELTRWFTFLPSHRISSLTAVDDGICHAYLANRSHRRDSKGRITAIPNGPGRRAAAVQIIGDLGRYRDLFADQIPLGLRPWGDAPPAHAAGRRLRGENATQPVNNEVLQPMLAASLYLAETIGPHLAELHRQYRQSVRRDQLPQLRRIPTRQLAAACARHVRHHNPLMLLPDSDLRQRLANGWRPEDPLLPVSLDALAQQAGTRVFYPEWLPSMRGLIEDTLAEVGCQPAWGRDAALVSRAGDAAEIPWTLPLHGGQLSALVQIGVTAALLVVAALSGMRNGELMELRHGCRRAEQTLTGLTRYKLASSLIKGQPLGGSPEQWVIIEPAYHAIGLAEQLANIQQPTTELLFGRFRFHDRYRTLRAFVNGIAGQRLGLAPIPEDPVNLRMIRRTLAIELAYRPGGLLAAKVALKHISTATAEGYAARPGGAQGQLLAEVSSHEQERNLQLILAEFRNYQNGIMPAGPGARELTGFFATVDSHLTNTATVNDEPRVQHSDRDILNLLSKRAGILHLGTANYCWYSDPAQALCHRLAGTPAQHTSAPMANMCDSARCPQATHHIGHRAVWAEHAATTRTILGTLGPTRTTERARLTGEYERAIRVRDAIDAATGRSTQEL